MRVDSLHVTWLERADSMYNVSLRAPKGRSNLFLRGMRSLLVRLLRRHKGTFSLLAMTVFLTLRHSLNDRVLLECNKPADAILLSFVIGMVSGGVIDLEYEGFVAFQVLLECVEVNIAIAQRKVLGHHMFCLIK
jgi:hypothetical protein